MAGKSTPKKWADVQLAIAAISMTTVLGFWNAFAGPDREKAALEATKILPTPTATETPLPTPVVTMPPVGYTILFGGEAPKPQVVVQQWRGGGGGDSGGGGGAVTSTGSS